MRSNTIVFMRITLAFIFLIGLVICLYWYPLSITLSTGIAILDFDPAEITPGENIEFYSQLLFYWLISIPCFVLVVMGFVNIEYMGKYGRFNIRSARLLFKMTLILFFSSLVFLIGNLSFMILGWNKFPILYCIIGGAGMALSAGLYAAHKYTANRSAEV